MGKFMKAKRHFALGLAGLLAGCAGHHDAIVFSDEAQVRAQAVTSTAPAVVPRMERGDELQIEQLVFGYLLEHPLWEQADYSAVFLQTEEAQVTALARKFPAHVPPIKSNDHAVLKSHRAPVDEDTGKAAMALTVELNEPAADGSVNATGRWYAGDAVTGFRTFHLTKIDDRWQIADVK